MDVISYLDTVSPPAFVAGMSLVGALTFAVFRASAKSLMWYAGFVILITSLWLTQFFITKSNLNVDLHTFLILERIRTLLILSGTSSAILWLFSILIKRRITKNSITYRMLYVTAVSSILVAVVLAIFQPYRVDNVHIYRHYILSKETGELVPMPPDF